MAILMEIIKIMKFRVFWEVAPCSHIEVNPVSEVSTASNIRAMMEAARTSETLVHFNMTTRRYFPEYSKRHTRRHENLKSHISKLGF
jgi:hypothetical protein